MLPSMFFGVGVAGRLPTRDRQCFLCLLADEQYPSLNLSFTPLQQSSRKTHGENRKRNDNEHPQRPVTDLELELCRKRQQADRPQPERDPADGADGRGTPRRRGDPEHRPEGGPGAGDCVHEGESLTNLPSCRWR